MNRLLITVFICVPQFIFCATANAQCGEAFGCPDAAQAEELTQTLAAYKEAVSIRQLDEADALAKRVMELSIVINGRESVHSANALTNLAYVQSIKGQYEPARLNYLAAIETIE